MTAPWIVALVALWLLVVVVATGLLGVVRLVGTSGFAGASRLVDAAGGIRPGEEPGAFTAAGVDGGPFTARSLCHGRHAVLFAQLGCPPCHRILDEIAGCEPGTLGAQVVVVVDGGQPLAAGHLSSGATFVVDRHAAMARAFDVRAAPVTFLVVDGRVTRAVIPSGLPDVLALGATETTIV